MEDQERENKAESRAEEPDVEGHKHHAPDEAVESFDATEEPDFEAHKHHAIEADREA